MLRGVNFQELLRSLKALAKGGIKASVIIQCDSTQLQIERGQSEQIKPSLREEHTLLRLIYIMAVTRYLWDPSAPRSSVPNEISEDATTLGVEIHTDTVRKWLQRSAEDNPPLVNIPQPFHKKPKIPGSLLEMIIVMAVSGYSWKPKAEKSSIVKEISDDAAKMGIKIDPDTVRKWLREAAALLPLDEPS